MRYRTWDARAQKWGRSRDVSSGTRSRTEAIAKLQELIDREERRRRGYEPVTTDARLGDAITAFLDDTHEIDEIEVRNRKGAHPVLGNRMKGKSWWVRTLAFAADLFRFAGDRPCVALMPEDIRAFDRFLSREGGARKKGLGQSTRSKTLKWLRRFCRWCVDAGHMTEDPTKHFDIPGERVMKQDKILAPEEVEQFWVEFEQLSLKAKCRVGLVLELGARSGEVDTIRAVDVSPAIGTVRRRLWKAGDEAEKVVRVSQSLMANLEAWIRERKLEGEDHLFPIRCHAGRRLLRKYGTSLRGLRRTVLTRLQDQGVALRVVQEVAGHTQLTTTQRYLGVGKAAVSDALTTLWEDVRMDDGRGNREAKASMKRPT